MCTNLYGFLNHLFVFPNNIILILIRPPVYVGRKECLLSSGINGPPKGGMAANQVNGILHVQINKRLCKIVHRLIAFTYCNENLSGTFSKGLSHGLIIQVIINEVTIVNQGELAEEIPAFLNGFFEQR